MQAHRRGGVIRVSPGTVTWQRSIWPTYPFTR